jgi:hypothetical protein
MSEVHRYKVVKMVTAGGNKLTYTPHGPEIVMAEHYDALATQRDEGLAREAELRSSCVDLSSRVRELVHKMYYWEGCNKALQQRLAEAEKNTFQARVLPWMNACFGEQISADKQERNHRFLEEALELIQACGATAEEARQLVDYVYDRPVGEPSQEVGGVMVTLAALCLAQDMDMHAAAETELNRIWGKVEQIRAKQAAKPALGPLPGSYPERLPGPSVSDQEQPS